MNNSNAKIMKMEADNCVFKNNFEQTVAWVTTKCWDRDEQSDT